MSAPIAFLLVAALMLSLALWAVLVPLRAGAAAPATLRVAGPQGADGWGVAGPSAGASPWLSGAVALGLVALALGLYALLGNPQALEASAQASDAAAADEASDADLQAMVARMAARLQQAPPEQARDPAAWDLLGRSLAATQRFAEAEQAYARAIELAAPDDPRQAQWLADRADLLALLRTMPGVSAGAASSGPAASARAPETPEQMVARSLRLDPDNLKALALAGAMAADRGDTAAAGRHWRRALTLAPPGSPFAARVSESLASIGVEAVAGDQARPQPSDPPAPATAARIEGELRIDAALLPRVRAGDTVFVWVRAAEGPRMPLAVWRQPAGAWPLQFRLDDSMAMSPQMRLSAFDRVVVEARVSRSGQATPASGDLIGSSAPMAPRQSGVRLTIDRIQP